MIKWLRAARQDVAQVFHYIAEHDRNAARATATRIYAAPERLNEFPKSGPERADIAEGLRSLSAGKYVLLYRVEDNDIEIVRVLHGARDLAAAYAADL